MSEVLSKVYLFSFCVGPIYFFIILAVSRFAASGSSGLGEDIDLDADDIDVDDFDDLDNIDDIDFDAPEADDLGMLSNFLDDSTGYLETTAPSLQEDLPDYFDNFSEGEIEFDEPDSLDDEIISQDSTYDFDTTHEPKEYPSENEDIFKVNYFSPRIWAISVCGFGAGGYSTLEVLGVHWIASLFFGIIVALLIGAFLFSILKYLYSKSSFHDLPENLEGKIGIVTLGIPYKKVGLVRIDLSTGNQEFRARTVHRRKLKIGEEVEVIRYNPKKHLLTVKENK